ncbi:hypothetical protein PVAND_010070 [Polypedilum vanderplanki]|uniref:Uncharacterized protein n=1 Tax=Polypedilum vanderplanki TaxID=319348 RepID=A0A9J6CF54_POLVA|nr:hypothetical protein PVAND_010070 [Polypedilum vanderplanki]
MFNIFLAFNQSRVDNLPSASDFKDSKMTNSVSIFISALLNILFSQQLINSVNGFSSFLILIATCLHLKDVNFLSDNYRTSKFFSAIVELVASSTVIEVMILMWRRFEILIEFFFKFVFMENDLNIYKEAGGDSLVGFIIIFIAISFLVYSLTIFQSSQNFTTELLLLLQKFKVYFANRDVMKNEDLCAECSCEEPKFKSIITTKNNSKKPAAH